MRTLAALFTLLTSFLVSLPAWATYYATTYQYDVHYHFAATAWDKPVQSVYVHTGVLEKRSGPQVTTYWEDVQHFPLTQVGDHFAGDARVHGLTGGGAGSEYVESQGAIVQYWVYFTDGTSLVTSPVEIPVRRGGVVLGETAATCTMTPYLGSPEAC